MIKFLVNGQNIETLENEIIADNQVSFVNVHFVFDNNWKPLHKVVQFAQDEFVYNMVLGYDGTVCKLPSELHAGAVKMSLFGYDTAAQDTVRATTVIHPLNIRPSGFDGESGSPIPPTPDLYQQLLKNIDEAELGKEKLSTIIRAFLERVEAAGYFVGLYGSVSSLVTHTENDIKEKYTIWLAHWCDNTNYSGAYGIWQHSCKGKVDGISGDVDLDKCYVDYPERIKAKGLNGYRDIPTVIVKPSASTLRESKEV